ncbi:hypothetical protein MTR67_032939 [Solanum verrucosum]|uniref:Uncharacterized protein n=1 Tax=Solanum verrucosum TaxID=315347 RepID=A0AAF0U5K5_SOLVR|nr:hypothetical protein MTR67_032939 [Solanum verrucosum]
MSLNFTKFSTFTESKRLAINGGPLLLMLY